MKRQGSVELSRVLALSKVLALSRVLDHPGPLPGLTAHPWEAACHCKSPSLLCVQR